MLLFFFNDTATTEIYTLSLHDALPILEVAAGSFFNGKEFVLPVNINFEHKKLFPGDIGPSTGEMGTTMFWSEPTRVFNATLKKMESKLREEHYVGYIDVNCMVNANGSSPDGLSNRTK